MDEFHLYLFGSPRLLLNGSLVELDTRKALALLTLLVMAGREQQRETLVAMLYPESDPDSARAAFRRTLSTLKRAVGPGLLSARRMAVGLAESAPLWVDVLEFKNQLSEPASVEVLERAADLYTDDFMAGFNLRDCPTFDDWQYQQSEDLRRSLLGVLERLADLTAAEGDVDRAIRQAGRRVELDPLLEEGHRQLMLLYARAGQRSSALRQYRECLRILEKELGVSPLEETTNLYQEILSGRIGPASRGLDSPEITEPASRLPDQIKEPTASSLVPTPPMIGRQTELTALTDILRPASKTARFISLEGEAGIGKTRLAEEFLTIAQRAGRQVIRGNCYEGEAGLAYGPFIQGFEAALTQPHFRARLKNLPEDILAEAARLLPGLSPQTRQPPPVYAEGQGARTRFFEALRQLSNCLLAGDPPGILFIDDLQWADSASMDLLTYLVHRFNPQEPCILAVWRSQEDANTERLRQLQVEQQREGSGLHLSLRRLNSPEIALLARGMLNAGGETDLPAGVGERLFEESEGLPFIALEYLRTMKPADTDWKIPGGVRDLLHRRLMTPGETARQLLAAMSIVGRPCDFNLIQEVSGRSEMETIAGLEELLALGIVREMAGGLYQFTHQKLSVVAYEEISQARRRLLHRRSADAILSGGQSRLETGIIARLAADHFLQAGEMERAAELFRQAGYHARRLYANGEALAAFQAAISAGHPDSSGLYEACGDLYTLMGKYKEAVDSYQTAAAYSAPLHLSNLMHKLGMVYHRLGEWEAADSHFQAAMDASGEDGDSAWLTHLYTDWSLTMYRSGQASSAQKLADQSLAQAQVSDDPGALAQAYNMQGILARASGAQADAERYFEKSLEFADRVEDLAMRCAALNNLARLLEERGQADQAVPLARQALELCARMGDLHRQAAIQNNLADLYHAAGMEKEAMEELQQAVALFAEIGENVGSPQPEIWKLTEW